MKRSFILILALTTLAHVSAQTAFECVDLPYGLSRGMENKHVLALQKFLYAKGLLMATPNGYFGPGTFAAVKSYQKTAGFSQVGVAGPATRAHIKKATCGVQASSVPQTVSASSAPSFPLQASVPIQPQDPVVALRPEFHSLDRVTLFSGEQTDWTFNLYGKNFSSSTNTVMLRNAGNGMIYTVGKFPSQDGATIVMPTSFGSLRVPCGTGCTELLPAAIYEAYVVTPGGQSEVQYLEIKPFTISARSLAETALPASGTNLRLGTLAFSTSLPVIVRSVSLVFSTSTISGGGVTVSGYSDAYTRQVMASDAELPAYQTMILEAQVSTSNKTPGTISWYFAVEVEDYIGKRRTKFVTPEILTTIQGEI